MDTSVAVVVPVFNGADTILRALQSIDRQTRGPDTVLIVDDGSTDATTEVVRAFIGARSTSNWCLVQQRNGGPGAARDTGIRAADATYVALLDADDEWSANHLDVSLAALRDQQLHVVGGRLAAPADQGQGKAAGPVRLLSRWKMLFSNPYFTSTVVLQRSAYLQVGGFDRNQRHSEDYKLWLTLALSGFRLGLLPASNARYRPAGTRAGLSAQLWRMERGELSNYRHLHRNRLISVPVLGVASAFSLLKFLLRLLRASANAVRHV